MDRKKILILIFALVVLVGGIFFILRSIGSKNQTATKPIQTPITPKKTPANIFGQANQTQATTTDVMGSIGTIAEKTITVTHLKESTVLNITGATPVMITAGTKTIPGQMADLKVGDAAKVTYDQTSKNVTMISIVRPEVAGKK